MCGKEPGRAPNGGQRQAARGTLRLRIDNGSREEQVGLEVDMIGQAKTWAQCLALVVLVILTPLVGPTPSASPTAPAAVVVVTSRTDSGPGSLRQAISTALPGDVITFDPTIFPPATPMTITLLAELPEITQGRLTIDGSNAGVVLDGRYTLGWSDGLRIRSDDNTVKGLQIVRFPGDGIELTGGASGNRIGGNWQTGSCAARRGEYHHAERR